MLGIFALFNPQTKTKRVKQLHFISFGNKAKKLFIIYRVVKKKCGTCLQLRML